MKALEVERDWAERNDHDQEALAAPKEIDQAWQIEPARAVATQRVRGKKRKSQQECIDDLLELRASSG
jgi:hypothetical protein